MENRLGATGRQAVANVEALGRLAWKADTLKILKQQGESVREYQELPGRLLYEPRHRSGVLERDQFRQTSKGYAVQMERDR